MDANSMSALTQLLWGLATLLGFVGTAAGAFSKIKGIKKASDEEIEKATQEKLKAVEEKVEAEHFARQTAKNVADMQADFHTFTANMDTFIARQYQIEKEFAVSQRDLKTVFKRIDELQRQGAK